MSHFCIWKMKEFPKFYNLEKIANIFGVQAIKKIKQKKIVNKIIE